MHSSAKFLTLPILMDVAFMSSVALQNPANPKVFINGLYVDTWTLLTVDPRVTSNAMQLRAGVPRRFIGHWTQRSTSKKPE